MSNPTQGASAELLPCPFCGGAARFERVGNWHDLVVGHVEDCFLSGDAAEMSYLDSPGVRERMAFKWNTRPAQPAAPVVPEGYVLVPKVATPEILEAIEDAAKAECSVEWDSVLGSNLHFGDAERVYTELLAASPQVAPQAEQSKQCWNCQQDYTAQERSDADGNCPRCGAEIELDEDLFAEDDAEAPQAEQVAQLEAQLDKMWKARFFVSQALHNVMVGNQSAWIEWKHGAGAEAAMQWIENGLIGPGLIPSGTDAQPWFDANQDDRYDVPPRPAQSEPAGAARQGGNTQPSTATPERAAAPAAADVDKHLDAVLRASGSALRHYSMPSTLDAMRAAMREALATRKAEGADKRDDRPCAKQMREAGLPAPRTCPTCGLGPCKFAAHQASAPTGDSAGRAESGME